MRASFSGSSRANDTSLVFASDGGVVFVAASTAATAELSISSITEGIAEYLQSGGTSKTTLGIESPSASEGGVRGRTAGMSLSRSIVDDEFVEHAESAEDAVSLKSSTAKSLRPSLCVDEGVCRGEGVGGLPARTRGCCSPMARNAESVICPDEAHVDDSGSSSKGIGSAKCGTSSDRRTATLVRWRH